MLAVYGDSFLDGYVENTDTYKALTGATTADLEAAQDVHKKDVLSRLFALSFLKGADQARCGWGPQ